MPGAADRRTHIVLGRLRIGHQRGQSRGLADDVLDQKSAQRGGGVQQPGGNVGQHRVQPGGPADGRHTFGKAGGERVQRIGFDRLLGEHPGHAHESGDQAGPVALIFQPIEVDRRGDHRVGRRQAHGPSGVRQGNVGAEGPDPLPHRVPHGLADGHHDHIRRLAVFGVRGVAQIRIITSDNVLFTGDGRQIRRHRNQRVVLQIRTDPGPVGDDRDAMPPQVVRRPNARQHQQFRAMERPRTNNNPVPKDLLDRARADGLDPNGPGALEQDAPHLGFRHQAQIGTASHLIAEVTVRGGPPRGAVVGGGER